MKCFRIDGSHMRMRGQVTDTKPAGLYIDGDTEPLDVHDMVVDVVVSFPFLEISSIVVVLDTHPHETCPSIEASYQQLVGTSISRGFSRKLTELFGGPNGCTHIGALLRAMAPVAVQSMYSMQIADPERPPGGWDAARQDPTAAAQAQAFTRNSCHVWDENGEMMSSVERGEPIESPIWIRDRLEKLDRLDELTEWR